MSSLGPLLNASGLGIGLGPQNISSLFFADDLVVVGKSQRDLETLMSITLEYFAKHRLVISSKKSKVMKFDSSTGTTVFSGPDSPSISLDEVLTFKYLGIHLNVTPHNLFKDFNAHVRKKAQSYRSSVLSLVKAGPDRSDLAYALWTCVALPSILYGSEVIPLNKGTLSEIQRCQNSVGKFILQIPQSSASVACSIDAGLQPVWSLVAKKVLIFAKSVMDKPSTYWPKLAMQENLSQGIKNPYTRYLLNLKSDCNIVSLSSPKHIKESVHGAAIFDVLHQQRSSYLTTFAMSVPDRSSNQSWFKPKSWVNDHGSSKIIAQFRACNIGLGNRGPAANGQFYKMCPLCDKTGLKALNNEVCLGGE